jgi:hypothetical protein
MIKKFKIESFKSIESAELDLGSVNVFIGANGSGKSNLLEGFGVLAAAAFGRVDTESLVRRGCRPSGYNRPLFREGRLDADTVVSAEGERTSYRVSLSSPRSERPAGWEFRREVWKHEAQVIVDRETTNGAKTGDPQSGLAALRLAEMPVESPAAVFLKALAAYSLYAPDTPILRGWTQDPQVREPIGLSGGRLADAVAELMKGAAVGNQVSAQFHDSVEWFSGLGIVEFAAPRGPAHVIAFMDRFFRTDNNQRYLLGPNDVNEGALYMLFLAVLCLHPNAPRLFALDNADHGLNPLLAKRLVKAMCDWLLQRKPARQVLMTTHNPLILDGLALEDDRVRLFTVDRDDRGTTQVRRFVITDQHRQMATKGWTLSRMWVNGLIGGVPNV